MSGRAKCRGCGRPIDKGEIRFGEALPNPFGDGEAFYWFHLPCAACMRPEKFPAALVASSEAITDREWLERAAEIGASHRRLPRLLCAERSPSGRARCRRCRNPIEKDAWRLALQMFEEGRFAPIGCIHVACSEAYFGTRDILDRIRRLTPSLTEDDAAAIERLLNEPPPEPAPEEPPS